MNRAEFERQVVAWCGRMDMPMANNALAFMFFGATPATEYHRRANPTVAADHPKAFSPFYTGDSERRPDYIRESLRLSSEKFAAGANDGSLHHAVLALNEELPDSFVCFPPALFGTQDERTLEHTKRMYERITGKSAALRFQASEFVLARPPQSTVPSLSLEGRLKQRMDVPYVIAKVADNPAYHGKTLLNAARKIDDDFPDGFSRANRALAEYHDSEYEVCEPRRENSMTVAEVLQYGAAHPESVRGKKIAALRSWYGGAVFDERGAMVGSGRFLVVDFDHHMMAEVYPESVDSVAGNGITVLTYKAIVMRNLFSLYERPRVDIQVCAETEGKKRPRVPAA